MRTSIATPWFRVALPLLVVAIWLATAGVGGPAFGKLSSIATNDQASFLPADADSTKVQNLSTNFIAAKTVPAVVVVESNSHFIPADMARLELLGKDIAKVSGVAAGPQGVVGPIPATDGAAAEFIVQVQGKASETVTGLRTVVAQQVPPDSKGYVTGPAGLEADLFKAFKGIDGILLYVALIAVFIILLLVYRSVVLPFIVLLAAMFALSAAGLVVYHGVSAGFLKLNGQSQGILSILAIGAATDYSLLIIARYREALEHFERPAQAIVHALKTSFEPISASAATVIAGVLCLLFSALTSNKDLGPVAATGIIFSYLTAITLLPALLLLLGRSAFWPFRPKLLSHGTHEPVLRTGLEDRRGLWRWVPTFIAEHPRRVWLISVLVLLGFALIAPQFKASGVALSDSLLGKSDAVTGQQVVARHFPAGAGSPAMIIASATKLHAVLVAAQRTSGIGQVIPYSDMPVRPIAQSTPMPKVINGQVLIEATLTITADSSQAYTVIQNLHQHVSAVDPSALVGGVSAISLDTNNAATADLHKIIPIVLFVILIILMLLLRSLVAPVLLIGSVILSFAASIGVSALMFNHVFHFAGSDAAIPLFAFIFLVALGVDYNIFLMTRVREESKQLGTRAGILRGLSVTGSVITSAGIVLAATFAALSVIPILFLLQIAFIVAFGVLLDTIVVRSLLVPALCYDIGRSIWWPSQLR